MVLRSLRAVSTDNYSASSPNPKAQQGGGKKACEACGKSFGLFTWTWKHQCRNCEK